MNTFNTAVASHYSTIETCVNPSELEDKMLNQSYRGVENLAMCHIDTNPTLLKNLREKGEVEKRNARAHELHQLNVRHRAYVADTRKALAYCFSKRALYVLIDEMADHDKSLAAKAGREFCDTFAELERAIISVEDRLSGKAVPPAIDVVAIARKEIVNRGSIRLEMVGADQRTKVKYALNLNTFRELRSHGWNVPASVIQYVRIQNNPGEMQ
jgi:hypothetical protein